MKKYIPWRVQKAAYLLFQYAKSLLSALLSILKKGESISFFPNYHQATTGATIAIASIANQLSNNHKIDGYVTKQSGFSKQFSIHVRHRLNPKKLGGKIIFVDIEQENKAIEALLAAGKVVILTCHALPEYLHAVPQVKLIRNLDLATYIHFVSEAQRKEFIQHYPQLCIEEKSFFIPNYTRQSKKNHFTGNVGVIGYLSRPDKNAIESIELGQQSKAKSIQCWGSKEIHGLGSNHQFSKLYINGWSHSVPQMHDSFDVLISTSKFETFGLVVAEALSAGIPCVISDIPPFRSLYADCEGVAILTGDRDKDVTTINEFLQNAPQLKQPIIDFWHRNFNSEIIKQMWLEKIENILSLYRQV